MMTRLAATISTVTSVLLLNACGGGENPTVPGDPELTNYHSGISLVWGVGDGSDKGTAYVEEYLYHDKTVSDRKIVYLRDTTAITMTHNAFNQVAIHNSGGVDTVGPFGFFRIIGANGIDGLANSGDEGIIRYRIDREGETYKFGWTPDIKKTPTFPAYSQPIRFADLSYESGIPVLGTTGVGNAYQRGILASNGDEWHVMAVGDDDSAHEPSAKTEQQGSDGKIYTFVVNPKAPAITVRAVGNAQFYTTPAKVYLAPKIHEQTTYIQPGSGSVSFELRDIFNRNIAYRINNGSWVNVGGSNVTLTDTSFSSGANTLEYRSAGYEGNARVRTVVKNPTHPSLAESHGHFFWGNADELSKITTRLTRAPYLAAWNKVKSTDSTMLNEWDANGLSPHRNPFFTSTWLFRTPLPTPQQSTAFIGLVNGFNTLPTGRTKNWGQYAKEQLLNGIWTRIDPVDYERNQSNGANPSTEVITAGYYIAGTVHASVLAYDILAGHYRSDQNANGLTPIEDYFLRDVLASAVLQTNYNVLVQGMGAEIGMWTGARISGSVMVAQCLKEYSTPYYGTSGYGAIQTRYAGTPHPTFSPTWKEIYATTPAQTATIPGTTAPAWTIEDPAQWQSNGMWGGPNLGYFNLMNRSYAILLNLNARHSPATKYPILELGIKHAIEGTLVGTLPVSDTNPPAYAAQPLVGNSYFPTLGPASRADLQTRNTESTTINEWGLFALLWYDDGK